MKDQIKELIENKGLNISDYVDSWELIEALDYDGSVQEIANANVDVYYYDLRKWSVENYSYIEDAMEEGLCEGVTDFHALIQVGQYVSFRNEANEIIEQLFKDFSEEGT